MFGWFRKKPPFDPEIQALADKWLQPLARAVAIAESVRDYSKDVAAGRVFYPAHRRKGESLSVVGVWRDVRLEAFEKAFNFGQSELALLADHRQQLQILNSFLDDRPHLEMPQPRGEKIADTLQGLWQVYVYLSAVGSEVADRETDTVQLKLKRRSILDALNKEARKLREQRKAFDNARREKVRPLPDMPPTLLDFAYSDVTAKAKSIALSTVFGPYYESNMEKMVELVAAEGKGGEQKIRTTMSQLLASKDPDEFDPR